MRFKVLSVRGDTAAAYAVVHVGDDGGGADWEVRIPACYHRDLWPGREGTVEIDWDDSEYPRRT